jgi:hypothetical protein
MLRAQGLRTNIKQFMAITYVRTLRALETYHVPGQSGTRMNQCARYARRRGQPQSYAGLGALAVAAAASAGGASPS